MTHVRNKGSFAGRAGVRFALSSLLMVIAVSACTTGQAQPSVVSSATFSSPSTSAPSPVAMSQPTPMPTQSVAPTATGPTVPAQPAAPTASAQPSKASAPAASAASAKNFKGFGLPDGDPCKLLSQADVEKALGKPIKSVTVMNDPNSGAKGCFYLNDPGKSFVSLSYLQGEDAKMQLLSNIAQLQAKGCGFSMTATTRRVTPTPLPPAVAALKPKSLVELFESQTQLLKEKCPPGSKDLAGVGEGALMDSLFRTVHIVAGEVYLMVLLADGDLTEQKQIEGVRRLATSLLK